MNKFSKKGELSKFSISILIVSVIIVIGVVIWIIVNGGFNLKDQQDSINQENLDLKISQVHKIDDSTLGVVVKREVGEGDFIGLSFTVSDGSLVEVVRVNTSMPEGQTGNFSLNFVSLNASKIKSISITPIFETKSGQEIVGETEDEYITPNICSNYCPVGAQCGVNGCGNKCGSGCSEGYSCINYKCIRQQNYSEINQADQNNNQTTNQTTNTSICNSTCESLGYNCGIKTICNKSIDCGNCSAGYSCNSTNKCVVNTCFGSFNQSCFIANGTGIQTRTCTSPPTWDNWSVCTVVSCNLNYVKSGNTCVTSTCLGSSTQSCNILNGVGSQSRECNNGVWGDWGTCNVVSCNPCYIKSNNLCAALNCNDNNHCTTDSCSNNVCVHNAISGCCTSSSQCSDNNVCTTDMCSSGLCSNVPISNCCTSSSQCSDNNVCTTDVCSVSTGICSNVPITPCCGNLIIEGIEQCDGTNLNQQTCSTRLGTGYSGILSCSSSCTFNTNSCMLSCTPETNTAFCTRLNKNCGSVTALDNCGISRTVSSCGNCSGTCTNGVCTTCTNDCTLGARECYGTGYRLCGNSDSDSCTEWIQYSCSYGCSGGYCNSAPQPSTGYLLVDHNAVLAFNTIPESCLAKARTLTMHYAHTSHGARVLQGLSYLETRVNSTKYGYEVRTATTAGLPTGTNVLKIYDGNNLDSGTYVTPDLYWETDGGITRTKSVVNTGDYDYSMWAWCGQMVYASSYINEYLSVMNTLDEDYSPNTRFILMTGHTDSGAWPTWQTNANTIKNYAQTNQMIIFDYGDMELYDPEGRYYTYYTGTGVAPDGYDTCMWCNDWCDSHPLDCVNLPSCAHMLDTEYGLVCVNEGKAFWWMMARLAGWDGVAGHDCV